MTKEKLAIVNPETPTTKEFTYSERLRGLVVTKLRQTKEKQQLAIAMDFDDHAIIPPPPEIREIVEAVSGSGMPIKDIRINKEYLGIESNHPSAGEQQHIKIGKILAMMGK